MDDEEIFYMHYDKCKDGCKLLSKSLDQMYLVYQDLVKENERLNNKIKKLEFAQNVN